MQLPNFKQPKDVHAHEQWKETVQAVTHKVCEYREYMAHLYNFVTRDSRATHMSERRDKLYGHMHMHAPIMITRHHIFR